MYPFNCKVGKQYRLVEYVSKNDRCDGCFFHGNLRTCPSRGMKNTLVCVRENMRPKYYKFFLKEVTCES